MRLRSVAKAEALRRTWLFSSCPARSLRSIAGCVDEVRVDAHTVLAREGERARQVFVVADGLVVLADAHGGRRRLASGSTIGEAEVLADGRYAGTLVAVEPSRVLVVEARAFRSLLSRDARRADLSLGRLAAGNSVVAARRSDVSYGRVCSGSPAATRPLSSHERSAGSSRSAFIS